jgi:hypothetical protein
MVSSMLEAAGPTVAMMLHKKKGKGRGRRRSRRRRRRRRTRTRRRRKRRDDQQKEWRKKERVNRDGGLKEGQDGDVPGLGTSPQRLGQKTSELRLTVGNVRAALQYHTR